MKKNNHGGSPSGLPLLTKIELTQKNLPLRIALFAVAVAVAIAAFGYGISALLNQEPGWNEIKVASGAPNCSRDFILNYYLGGGEVSASVESKQLSTLYTKATEDAFRLFSNEYTAEDFHNIQYVNAHVNQEITVEPGLYTALEQIVKAKNRSIYLAPVYMEYQRMFLCEADAEAAQYDPVRQPELAEYISKICTFAHDSQMINIQLLGENRVRLHIDQAYLEFAEENGIEVYLDFSWMTNAFIADYIAQMLIDNGFTRGYLASYDGFTRNLWQGEQTFGLNVFAQEGNDIVMPATVEYPGGNSVVTLRSFPLSETDRWHYYAFLDGRIASLLIDPVTGKEMRAVSALTCYSATGGCADILLAMAPLYLSEQLDTQALNDLVQQGIYAFYPEENVIFCNDPALKITPSQDANYQVQVVE